MKVASSFVGKIGNKLNLREICFKTVGPIRSSQMIRSTECGRNRLLPAFFFFFFEMFGLLSTERCYICIDKNSYENDQENLWWFFYKYFFILFCLSIQFVKHCDVKFTRDTILNFWHKTIRKWIDEFERACRFVTRTGGLLVSFCWNVVGIWELDKLESRRVS